MGYTRFENNVHNLLVDEEDRLVLVVESAVGDMKRLSDVGQLLVKDDKIVVVIEGDIPSGPVTSADITDATTVGKAVLVAVDAAAARTAIGAGTSNLAIGATGSTAKVGNYTPSLAEISAQLITLPGYSAGATQSLKNAAGTLTWVTDV